MASVKKAYWISGGCLAVYDDGGAIVVDGYCNPRIDDEAEELAQELGVEIRSSQLVNGWDGVDRFLMEQGYQEV